MYQIIDGTRKRTRIDVDQSSPLLGASLSLASGSHTQRRGSSSTPVPPQQSTTIDDAAAVNQAIAQGFRLLDYVIQRVDPADGSPLCIPFLALPSRADYPDYYELIKTPVSLEQVRRRLQARQFTSLEEIRNALETIWRNAKRYNLKGSEIYEKARILHGATRESYVDLMEKDQLAPVMDGAPLQSTPPLMEQSAKLAKVEKPDALARLDYDENARGPPTVSLRVKKEDDLPYEEDEGGDTSWRPSAVGQAPDMAAKEESEPRNKLQATTADGDIVMTNGQDNVGQAKKEPPHVQQQEQQQQEPHQQQQRSQHQQPDITVSPRPDQLGGQASTTVQSEAEEGEEGDVVELADMPGYDHATGLLNGKPVDSSFLTRDGKFDRRKRPGPRGKRLKSTLRHLIAEMRIATSQDGTLLCGYFFELPSKADFPDYYQHVQMPISLNHIESKAVHNKYVNPYALAADLRLMVSNAKYYNEENSPVWRAADELEGYIEQKIVGSLIADGFSLDPQDMRQSALPMEYAAASPIAAHAAAFRRNQGLIGGQHVAMAGTGASHSPEPLSRLRMQSGDFGAHAASPPANGVMPGHGAAMHNGGPGIPPHMASNMSNASTPAFLPQQPSNLPFSTPSARPAMSPNQQIYTHGQERQAVPVQASQQQHGNYPFPAHAPRPGPPSNGVQGGAGAMSPPQGQPRPMYPPGVNVGQSPTPFQRPPLPQGSGGSPGMPPFMHSPMHTSVGVGQGAQSAPAVRMPKRLSGEIPPSPFNAAKITLADGQTWRRKPVMPSFMVKTQAAQGDSCEVILSNSITRMHSICIGAARTPRKGDVSIGGKGKKVIVEFRLRNIVFEDKSKQDGGELESLRTPWKVAVRLNGRSTPFEVRRAKSKSEGNAAHNNTSTERQTTSPTKESKRSDAIDVAQGSTCVVPLHFLSSGMNVLDVTISPGAPDSRLSAIANDASDPNNAKARAILQTPDKYRIFLQHD